MTNHINTALFFEREYQSSANEILYRHIDSLEREASALDIDINTALNHLSLPSSVGHEVKLSDSNSARFALNKNNRGRAAIWLKVKETKAGVQYPVVTLKSKGTTATWSGYDSFKDEYDRQRALSGNAQAQQELTARQKKQAQQATIRQQQQQQKQLERLKLEKAQSEAAATLKDEYLLAYSVASVTDGNEQYLIDKKINQIVTRLPNVRTVHEFYDNTLSSWRPVIPGHDDPQCRNPQKTTLIPLAQLGKSPAGLQRLSASGKYQTAAVKPGDYQGAFAVIGPALTNGKNIDICEGFATSISAYAASKNTTLFAVSADNVKTVTAIILAAYPDSTVRVISDNDIHKAKEGKGNKGMLTALDLIQAHGHKKKLKVFIPKVLATKGTDINDIHVNHPSGLTEVENQLANHKQHIKLSRFDDRFQLALSRFTCLSHTAQRQPQNIKKVALSGLALAPSKYALDDILAHILGAAKKAGNTLAKGQVKAVIDKAANMALWGAQKSRAFSRQRLNNPSVKYKFFNTTTINSDVIEYINSIQSGVILLRAPMGSGKTQRLIKPLIDQPGKSAYLAHRVSLISGATEALNTRIDTNGNKSLLSSDLSIKHYRNDLTADSAPFITKLACCVNSVINPIADAVCQNLDQLFVDEAAQTLDSITVGGAMFNPQAVFNKMLDLLKTTRRVVLCDADANDNLLTFCELANQDRENGAVHVIELKTDCSDITILHTDHASIVAKIEAAALAGEKIVIATDNCAEAEAMHQSLMAATGKKGIMITGKNAGEDLQQDFLTNLNKHVDASGNIVTQANLGAPWLAHNQISWLIYSPAITSGVSIELNYFTQHFGRFSGISISPSEAIQMLRRDRTAKTFTVGLKPSGNGAETDASKIINAFYRAQLEQNDLSFQITDDFKTIIQTADPDFDKMRALALANIANAKSNFSNNLLWSMVADGYQVQAAQTDDQQIEHGKHLIESSREFAKEALITLVSGVQTPSKERLESLQSKNMVYGLSGAEQAEIVRHEIETKMQVPVTDESIIDHKNGALRKLKNAELLFRNEKNAKRFDDIQATSGRAASRLEHASKKRHHLHKLFSILGLNIKTGAGEPSSEMMRQAYEYFTSNDLRDLNNSVLKIGAPVRQGSTIEPTKWVQGALERCGIKLARTTRKNTPNGQQWHYAIDRSEFNSLRKKIAKRLKNNITDWPVIDLLAGTSNAKTKASQPLESYKAATPPVLKEKSIKKHGFSSLSALVNKVAKSVNAPVSYVKSLLDRALIRDIVNSRVNYQQLQGILHDNLSFDHPNGFKSQG